ncbi:MAG: hypothetical protein IJ033_04655 [Clostridia bacterium]|nr:hypothetical protein [Clostridia bacterium]
MKALRLMLIIIMIVSCFSMVACVADANCDEGHDLNERCVCTRCNQVIHNMGNGCICQRCSAPEHTEEDGVCTKCNRLLSINGSTFTLGLYPQSKVTDTSLIDILNQSAGEAPSYSQKGEWISYGYYKYGAVEYYAWYIDKEYNGEKYRGVIFSDYRPSSTINSGSSSATYQDDNGYLEQTVYWFKYEPIRWSVVKQNNGKALAVSQLILDSQCFYTDRNTRENGNKTIYANNWEQSSLRQWLNNDFYNAAFSDNQKNAIIAESLDNKTTAYDGSYNDYANCQNNTTDNVFLLSYKDVTDTALGFNSSNLRKWSTDYAKAQGLYSSPNVDYKGLWWLRSADSNTSSMVALVNPIGTTGNQYVNTTSYGVVPAIIVNI